ncbi:MAG: hypothetical protein ACYDHY_15850 [Acidiferrobacterales bacterium]
MVFVKILLGLLEVIGGGVLVASILAFFINGLVEITYSLTGKLKQLEPVERLTLRRLMRKRNWTAMVAMMNFVVLFVFIAFGGSIFPNVPETGHTADKVFYVFVLIMIPVSSFIMIKRIQPVHTAYLYLSQRADTLRSAHHLEPYKKEASPEKEAASKS